MAAGPTLHTTMGELMDAWPAAREVLARRGMACVGCAMAPFETIAEAAAAYGFDPAGFLREVLDEPASSARVRRRTDRAPRPRDRARQRRS